VLPNLNYAVWPVSLLQPSQATASPVAFTRSGGRSLGGVERTTRTDAGFWRIALNNVTVWSPSMRRKWNALRTALGGKAGLVAVPVWSFDSAPYPSGEREPIVETNHDDGFGFDDGLGYSEGSINIEMASFAPLGATVVTLRLVEAISVEGIRFSYQHALYETGPAISEVEPGVFQVPIFPAVRMPIPQNAELEVDQPTCLCRLADDRGMDLPLNNSEIDSASIEFVEAVDVWNDLAIGLISYFEVAD
jgi:hypothetical protein